MNVKKISAVLTTILLSAAASATDWTGAVDSDWWNTGNWADAPEEPPTGYVGFADWRIKYSAAKKTTVDLGGRTVTLTDNLAVETSADWAITLTNGSLRIEAEGKGLDVHNGSSAARLTLTDVTVAVNVVKVGGAGWNGGGTGVVEQVSGTVTAGELCLVNGEASVGTYVMKGGTAHFDKVNFGANNWVSKGDQGTLRLEGGVLETDALVKEHNGCERPTLVFDGGILKLTSADAKLKHDWLTINVTSRGLGIDTEERDLTIEAGTIAEYAEDASLIKTGAGTLSLKDVRTWSGTVTVNGGTLDLGGGSVTGDIVYAGDGKIVNADLSSARTVTVCGRTVTLDSPLDRLLASAAAWYDPSDETTLTIDAEKNGVTKVANKSARGATMDATIYNAENGLPSLATMNGLTALAFTNNQGFVSARQTSTQAGKAIFAVSRRDDALRAEGVTDDSRAYSIGWCQGGWIWDAKGAFLIFEKGRESDFFIRYLNESGTSADKWLSKWGEGSENQVDYVRGLCLIDGLATGFAEDKDGSLELTADLSGCTLEYGEKERVSYGWSIHDGSRTAGLIGEALAYDRSLTQGEADLVRAYLVNKWIEGSRSVNCGTNVVEELTLENGTVDCHGASLAVGTLSGTGGFSSIDTLIVTDTLTVDRATDLTVAGDVDLTGSKITVDANVDDFDVVHTILTATGTITGLPTVVQEPGDKRRIVVRQNGKTLTVMCVHRGLVVVIR